MLFRLKMNAGVLIPAPTSRGAVKPQGRTVLSLRFHPLSLTFSLCLVKDRNAQVSALIDGDLKSDCCDVCLLVSTNHSSRWDVSVSQISQSDESVCGRRSEVRRSEVRRG